jgi:hypothetical protein
MRCILIGGALVALGGGRAKAQSPAPSAHVVEPGATELVTAGLRGDSARYRTVRSVPGTDSAERDLGLSVDATVLTTYRGAVAVLLVQRSTPRGKLFVDSAVMLQRGLTPAWEWSQFGTRVSRITYDGARVRRTDREGDSVVRQVDHTYGVRVFPFAVLDLVVRSVPLHDGYRAILPLYSEGDDALEMDTVQVIGRGPDGVWDVRFADPVIIAHYGIADGDRTIARLEIERHAGGPHFRRVPEPNG